MKSRLTQQGFTLVELMVVVAIIGILSVIAVPNFQKYQAKAKQSEAKLSLSALYTVQTAFKGDFDTYATCLRNMGVEQPAEGYYIFGFRAANATVNKIATDNGATCDASSYYVVPGESQNNKLEAPDKKKLKLAGTNGESMIKTAMAATYNGHTADAAQNEFYALACGNIYKEMPDVWSINQVKSMRNEKVGY